MFMDPSTATARRGEKLRSRSHSTLDDYLKVHRTLGLTRAVIVTAVATAPTTSHARRTAEDERKFQGPRANRSGNHRRRVVRS